MPRSRQQSTPAPVPTRGVTVGDSIRASSAPAARPAPQTPARPNPAYDARVGDSFSYPETGKRDLKFFPPERVEYKGWLERVNTPRRYVSVELEIGGIRRKAQKWRLAKAIEKWHTTVVCDGSLPSTGFELNTQPAKGRYFEEQVTDLCKALKSAGAWVNTACGLHVHVDCRDLSPSQILRLVEVYGKIEVGLFLVVPGSRRDNAKYSVSGRDYCAKCARKLLDTMGKYLKAPEKTFFWGTDPANVKQRNKDRTRRLLQMTVYEGQGGDSLRNNGEVIPPTLKKTAPAKKVAQANAKAKALVLGRNLVKQVGVHYSSARYWALNLHPYFYRPPIDRYATIFLPNGREILVRSLKPDEQYRLRKRRGTIESRLAAGTIDPVKVLNWARLWDQIVYASTAWPTDRLNGLSKDPFLALLAIADDPGLQKWLTERKKKFEDHAAPPDEEW